MTVDEYLAFVSAEDLQEQRTIAGGIFEFRDVPRRLILSDDRSLVLGDFPLSDRPVRLEGQVLAQYVELNTLESPSRHVAPGDQLDEVLSALELGPECDIAVGSVLPRSLEESDHAFVAEYGYVAGKIGERQMYRCDLGQRNVEFCLEDGQLFHFGYQMYARPRDQPFGKCFKLLEFEFLGSQGLGIEYMAVDTLEAAEPWPEIVPAHVVQKRHKHVFAPLKTRTDRQTLCPFAAAPYAEILSIEEQGGAVLAVGQENVAFPDPIGINLHAIPEISVMNAKRIDIRGSVHRFPLEVLGHRFGAYLPPGPLSELGRGASGCRSGLDFPMREFALRGYQGVLLGTR